MADKINHPTHYNKGDVECIDAIKSALSKEQYKGFLKGNVIKYVWRCDSKNNSIEDLKKSKWYLDALIKEEEETEAFNRCVSKNSKGVNNDK